MGNFAIIGLGRFGRSMLQSLARRRVQIVAVDQNEDKIQWARDLATKAVKADALKFEVFREILPDGLAGVIVDLGDQMERSILVTNYLHKLKIPNIIVEAMNPEHAEILQIVGATRVVFPEKEAAERIAGLLTGHGTLDYFPVSEAFSLIEIAVPAGWIGRTLAELDLRRNQRINVVAYRLASVAAEDERWELVVPDRQFERNDIILVAGNAPDVQRIQQ